MEHGNEETCTALIALHSNAVARCRQVPARTKTYVDVCIVYTFIRKYNTPKHTADRTGHVSGTNSSWAEIETGQKDDTNPYKGGVQILYARISEGCDTLKTDKQTNTAY